MNYVFPSILSANFANLESDIKLCEEAKSYMLHIDVMDGHFVPNITIGPVVIQSIRKVSNLELDCHLMIQNPELYIESVANAGAKIITVHAEAVIHLERLIKKIKSFNCMAGVSIVPTTHESVLEYIIHELDLVLIMTVNPGFGGQQFIHSQLDKIAKVKEMIQKTRKEIILQVDGGITQETAVLAKKAGANGFVAGNFLFEDRETLGQKVSFLKNI